MWCDMSDVKLAEAVDDRASFQPFFCFSRTEATPERTALVRLRKALMAHKLDRLLFTRKIEQLKAKAITVKSGALMNATIIGYASQGDDDGRRIKHKRKTN